MSKDEIIGEEAKSWREKALQAAEILRKISQPPLVYATVLGVDKETVDIATNNGQTYVVSFNPKIKDKIKMGVTVRLSPETMAVVDVAGNVMQRSATTVKDVLKDGRIKIDHQGLERVIQSSIAVKVGDNVLVDNSYSVVVESLGNSSRAYKIDKVPEVPWSSIGGLEGTIESIRDTLEMPFLHRAVYDRFPNKKPAQGVLLYGPPGCGKTMLGKGIAYNLALMKKQRDGGELNGYFMYVAGPEFLQKWVGTGEAKVREMFATARETAAENGDPVVIFMDEPESVLKKRGTGISSDATDSIVNQILCEMDGLRPRDNVYVVLATNREDILDPAIIRPGRIDKKIYVPRPNQESAEKIFSIYLKDLPFASDGLFRGKPTSESYAKHAASEVFEIERPMAYIFYRDGSRDTIHYQHVFSGASAVSIVGRATDLAIKRGIQKKNSDLTREDISVAINAEYEENRRLTNLIAPEDVRAVAGDRISEVADVRPAYIGNRSRSSDPHYILQQETRQ